MHDVALGLDWEINAFWTGALTRRYPAPSSQIDRASDEASEGVLAQRWQCYVFDGEATGAQPAVAAPLRGAVREDPPYDRSSPQHESTSGVAAKPSPPRRSRAINGKRPPSPRVAFLAAATGSTSPQRWRHVIYVETFAPRAGAAPRRDRRISSPCAPKPSPRCAQRRRAGIAVSNQRRARRAAAAATGRSHPTHASPLRAAPTPRATTRRAYISSVLSGSRVSASTECAARLEAKSLHSFTPPYQPRQAGPLHAVRHRAAGSPRCAAATRRGAIVMLDIPPRVGGTHPQTATAGQGAPDATSPHRSGSTPTDLQLISL